MSAPTEPNPAHHPCRIIADVDTGIDDALALLYLTRSPLVDLHAVTCVAGNTSVERALQNTLAVLDVAGADATIPVAAGAEQPLVSPARSAHGFHGSNGIGGLELPAPRRTPDRRLALELIRDAVEESDVPITLLALGPLTNVALFIRAFPAVARRLERIVFMGGAMATGNATPVAEFNAWHDPEALDIVLRSGIPTTMYGLDVFDQVTLSEGETDHLRRAEEPGTRLVGDLFSASAASAGLAFLGDAGAACVAVGPDLAKIASLNVHVELAGTARGQTIVDRRQLPGEAELHAIGATTSPIDVVTDVDVERIIEAYLAATTGV